MSSETTATRSGRPKTSGPGRTLIVFYFIMWIAALFRSIVQILTEFDNAPVAYLVSFASGVVYLVATIALITPGRVAYRIAAVAMSVELAGVLIVGTLTVIFPDLFPFADERSTVWTYYGVEYLLIPLALPIFGLLFLRSQRSIFAKQAV